MWVQSFYSENNCSSEFLINFVVVTSLYVTFLTFMQQT